MLILLTVNTLIPIIDNNTKDFFNICFWILTLLLAFITYSNAKKTLFNPIRSEMVKYQMKIITEFIDNHTSKGFDFDNAIDYSNLLKLNYETDYLFSFLVDEQEFEKKDFDEVDEQRAKYCRENLGGFFEINIEQNKLFLELFYGDFDTARKYIQTEFIRNKELRYNYLVLQRFYINKKFYSFYTDLLNLKSNPFIPAKIKLHIDKIISNVHVNIGVLYKILSKHISQQTESKYQKIYSEFIEQRIDHQKDLQQLRNTISIYFKVNNI